ncbi:MAG: glycoside hydrolase family 3 N-terminal domain-containing protein, partial [Acidobacteriota bacterium]
MLEKILSLPLNQKIGQLFFIGISGTEVDERTSELLTEISPGGVCLFARNVKTAEQVAKLLGNIRQILPAEPFLSIDEEGGVVDRLRRISTPMPSASSIKTTEQIKTLAETTAEILLILGFNMNFAPVVDVLDGDRKSFTNGLYS